MTGLPDKRGECPIYEMEFSVRTNNCLAATNLFTMGAVYRFFEKYKFRKAAICEQIPKFGAKSYREVLEALEYLYPLSPSAEEQDFYQWAVLNRDVLEDVRWGNAHIIKHLVVKNEGEKT